MLISSPVFTVFVLKVEIETNILTADNISNVTFLKCFKLMSSWSMSRA